MFHRTCRRVEAILQSRANELEEENTDLRNRLDSERDKASEREKILLDRLMAIEQPAVFTRFAAGRAVQARAERNYPDQPAPGPAVIPRDVVGSGGGSGYSVFGDPLKLGYGGGGRDGVGGAGADERSAKPVLSPTPRNFRPLRGIVVGGELGARAATATATASAPLSQSAPDPTPQPE